MADLSDVSAAIGSIVAAACYPDGPAAGVAPVSPTVGCPVFIAVGWPDAAQLDLDLAAGIVTATIYSAAGHSRVTNRYIDDWRPTGPMAPTLTATVSGQSVTLGGVGGPVQVAGVLVYGVAYAVLATTTPSAAAAALAAIVPGAAASGAVLTLDTDLFDFRVGSPVGEEREVRRQIQGFRVILWCPTDALRTAAATVIDGALAVFDEDFIVLSDGTGGLLRYCGTLPDDVPSNAGLWKRTLDYSVEYPTLQTRLSPPILWPLATQSPLQD